MTAILHDMVEDIMEVFMDDFSVFGNPFNCCLANLDRMLARFEETNLVLNWEKCDFMVKEGIMLGHKISEAGIEVDRPKIDVIAKLPYPTNVKRVRSFLGQRIDGKFKPIYYASKTLNNSQEHYTTTEKELLAVEAENLAADHLSILENPDMGVFTKEEIVNEFLNEHLMKLKAELNDDEPWYADYANYIVGKIVPPKWTPDTLGDTTVPRLLEERSFGYNPKDWSEKLNDALSAFRTAYKTLTGCTPFRLVYGKACHLYVEIKHKAYWALNQCKIDLAAAAKNCFIELNELMELRDGAYENTRIYKERTKKWNDSKLRGDKDFKVGDHVLEITNKNRISFKVNGHRLKQYYDGHIDMKDKEVVKVEEDTTHASPKPSKPRLCLRWSPTGRIFDFSAKLIESSDSECQSDSSKGDNACNSNLEEPTRKLFPNSTSFCGRALCYPKNNREDIGKLGVKGSLRIHIEQRIAAMMGYRGGSGG
ncbi:reverse transcriptase domain-containing protein [Tanacetum coccineum]|uniref:Reverse transcriptase domain-containing protein n=1 Tax=Tanacetum coccineum TaxID=301880 RepID=A0ABQ4X887_9ASTR